MIITASWLKKQEACPEQVKLFRSTFGEVAEVTPETLARALEVGLSLVWLAGAVLTDSALAEVERVTAPAWAEYRRARDAAWAEYGRARGAARAEYGRVRDSAAARLLADPANWRDDLNMTGGTT